MQSLSDLLMIAPVILLSAKLERLAKVSSAFGGFDFQFLQFLIEFRIDFIDRL